MIEQTRLDIINYFDANSFGCYGCREFNQNPNLWETKQIEKTHAKENNHTHKTIFTWFGNLPTSMELQGFYYYQGKYNSAQEHSQETQFPIHPNSFSPTRQENTIFLLMRLLLGFRNSLITHGCLLISNLIYIFIYIYVKVSRTRNYIPSWIRSTWACGNSSHTGLLQQRTLHGVFLDK